MLSNVKLHCSTLGYLRLFYIGFTRLHLVFFFDRELLDIDRWYIYQSVNRVGMIATMQKVCLVWEGIILETAVNLNYQKMKQKRFYLNHKYFISDHSLGLLYRLNPWLKTDYVSLVTLCPVRNETINLLFSLVLRKLLFLLGSRSLPLPY